MHFPHLPFFSMQHSYVRPTFGLRLYQDLPIFLLLGGLSLPDIGGLSHRPHRTNFLSLFDSLRDSRAIRGRVQVKYHTFNLLDMKQKVLRTLFNGVQLR